MFTFSVTDIGAVLARGRADADANGGYRVPYHGISPDSDARAGLWLVGDESVYAMSNGKLAGSQRALVVYAEECNPQTNPDYWHYKRQYFGGDDGVEFLDAMEIERLITAAPDATHLRIIMDDSSMSIELIR
ncbi:DUF3085 domain-containing protein (plasmid) [Agrobacterium leguminum]|uniref:DUF3085 domain-containing protein n=1 Tax=Agrobacterium deltaense NCPPB 1641 TaxID=1183425 RepID=A0A1S7UBR2_9HYPH|nr:MULTISPECIES: DUF3085 domain-containing protein [Agrobacterium]WFS69471.1 DUF3085 domain-containing protein [Agrobacterium leguminum]CVI64326.1 conserved hypothetical protein [Agrobacterium deltaense NCPPB 1641]